MDRDDEELLPKTGDSLEIQIFNDGTMSEYQPVGFAVGTGIFLGLGIITLILGIIGRFPQIGRTSITADGF